MVNVNSAMDEDISRLKTTAVSVLSDLGCNGSTLTEDLINEMCRFGAAELHAVAALVGGIASQEVIKVLSLSCQLSLDSLWARSKYYPCIMFYYLFLFSYDSFLGLFWLIKIFSLP